MIFAMNMLSGLLLINDQVSDFVAQKYEENPAYNQIISEETTQAYDDCVEQKITDKQLKKDIKQLNSLDHKKEVLIANADENVKSEFNKLLKTKDAFDLLSLVSVGIVSACALSSLMFLPSIESENMETQLRSASGKVRQKRGRAKLFAGHCDLGYNVDSSEESQEADKDEGVIVSSQDEEKCQRKF